ncbi:hypothetical protein [Profundibacter amoris]|uniref:Uncharacterized protein n=1 Tax=Profundibacter amoris TaxID=2171755 RepID=A0A347UHW0_9RHOB|nr:hypothetical protein [Profundibacter amoris]AXX98438.1 hypothetical protein BAR1_11170 [Profundibacter amoris]
MKTVVWTIAALCIAGAARPETAKECVVDPVPECVQQDGAFADKAAEQTCRQAVKDYQHTVTAFWDCQRAQASKVDREARKVIRLFNCRKRGKETCE